MIAEQHQQLTLQFPSPIPPPPTHPPLQVMRQHKSGILTDYCDGEEFSSHSLFGTTSSTLQLLLYYDDVEVCNPLGSSRVKHKLGKNKYGCKVWVY